MGNNSSVPSCNETDPTQHEPIDYIADYSLPTLLQAGGYLEASCLEIFPRFLQQILVSTQCRRDQKEDTEKVRGDTTLSKKRVEFGICGIDNTIPKDHLNRLFMAPAHCSVQPVAAFQLGYQGYPGKPTPKYSPGAPLADRRYEGRTYLAWDEIDAMIKDTLPPGTLLSFHLNETKDCPYVSGLLKGDKDILNMVAVLCQDYKAHHIQINLGAFGVPANLFMSSPEESSDLFADSASQIAHLAKAFPMTTFLVSIFQRKDKDSGMELDSAPFVDRIFKISAQLCEGKPSGNLAAFHDNSAGNGRQPDSVPEIPKTYPRFVDQPVGFTGGINAENVKLWLARFSARAREHGCVCISDAQSGFRVDGKRENAVDVQALNALCKAMYEWGVEDAKTRA